MCSDLIKNLMDADVKVSDDEIKALASMSHKIDAKIYETKSKGNYFLVLSIKGEDEKVLISSSNLEEYENMSKDFFKKFVKYNGNISLDEIFVENVMSN